MSDYNSSNNNFKSTENCLNLNKSLNQGLDLNNKVIYNFILILYLIFSLIDINNLMLFIFICIINMLYYNFIFHLFIFIIMI